MNFKMGDRLHPEPWGEVDHLLIQNKKRNFAPMTLLQSSIDDLSIKEVILLIALQYNYFLFSYLKKRYFFDRLHPV